MDGIQRSDVVVACVLAVLAAFVGGGSLLAGALVLVFLGGVYLSLRLTRGRPVRFRLLAIGAAFVMPLLVVTVAMRT